MDVAAWAALAICETLAVLLALFIWDGTPPDPMAEWIEWPGRLAGGMLGGAVFAFMFVMPVLSVFHVGAFAH